MANTAITIALLLSVGCIIYFKFLQPTLSMKEIIIHPSLGTASVGISALYLLWATHSNKNDYIDILQLMTEIDTTLKELHISVTYVYFSAFAIITSFGTCCLLILVDTYLLLACDNLLVSICECICTNVALILYHIAFFTIMATSSTSAYKLNKLNSQLKQEISNSSYNDDIDIDEIFNGTDEVYNNDIEVINIQLVMDVYYNTCHIATQAMRISSTAVLIILHLLAYFVAAAIFVYIKSGSYLFEVIFMSSFGTLFIVMAAIFNEVTKRQLYETVSLVCDWTICYFDPTLINARNAMLMQALQRKPDFRAGQLMPLDMTVVIFLAEFAISAVVVISQTISG